MSPVPSEPGSRVCGYCQQAKPHLDSGQRLRDGSRIFVDRSGRRWAGRRCPACERGRVQSTLRCDPLQRDAVVQQLENAGFEIVSKALPLRARKDGAEYRVAIRQATLRDGGIHVPAPSHEPEADLYAVVFATVRLLTREQIARMEAPSPEKPHAATPPGPSPEAPAPA